jgi:hypothetical protein
MPRRAAILLALAALSIEGPVWAQVPAPDASDDGDAIDGAVADGGNEDADGDGDGGQPPESGSAPDGAALPVGAEDAAGAPEPVSRGPFTFAPDATLVWPPFPGPSSPAPTSGAGSSAPDVAPAVADGCGNVAMNSNGDSCSSDPGDGGDDAGAGGCGSDPGSEDCAATGRRRSKGRSLFSRVVVVGAALLAMARRRGRRPLN